MPQKIHVVRFEHNSDSDENVLEAFTKAQDANTRAAQIANEHTDEDEVRHAYAEQDYDAAIDLFITECENGADHQLSVSECDLK